jgi:hypothetical protein
VTEILIVIVIVTAIGIGIGIGMAMVKAPDEARAGGRSNLFLATHEGPGGEERGGKRLL